MPQGQLGVSLGIGLKFDCPPDLLNKHVTVAKAETTLFKEFFNKGSNRGNSIVNQVLQPVSSSSYVRSKLHRSKDVSFRMNIWDFSNSCKGTLQHWTLFFFIEPCCTVMPPL